jgi:capsule polysaccharide export protein KpsE/RkpR
MREPLSFGSFFQLLVERWRTFAVVGAIAAFVAAVFSGPTFIKPRYRSSAIVYPVNLTSYSQETRSDQLLQLLESNSIRDSLIRLHRLPEHYGIDTTEAPGLFYLYNEYNDHVAIGKTRYESVEIEIEDEDPRVAQRMVLDLLDQADKLARRLQREKSQEVLRIADRELRLARHKLDSVESRLDTLRRRTGLLNYDAQTNEVTRGYMRMLASGTGGSGREEARALLRALGEQGGEFDALTDLANAYRGILIDRQNAHEKALTDINKELTYTNTVVYPELPDKKVYPIRWLIVAIATASAMFLAFVLLLIRQQRP